MNRGSNPLDLVASLGGAALSGLQMGANAAVVVGGGMGQAMLSVGKDVGKAFAGEAAFFDESITVRVGGFLFFLHPLEGGAAAFHLGLIGLCRER